MKEIFMSTDEPLITTIIPTYKRPKLLRRAILSVLNQSYKNIRVCIYDNASGDETSLVVANLAKLDNRVKYFCHDSNIGGLKNYVHGLSNVQTPFFSLFADDDFLLPNFYEDAMSDFKENPKAMFVCLSTAVADQRGRIHWESNTNFNQGLFLPPNGLHELVKRDQISLPWTSILYRKEILEQGMELDENIKFVTDVDWSLRCCSKFPFVINSKRGAIFSMRHDLITFKNLLDDLWPDWMIMVENMMSNEEISLDIRLAISKWLKIILLGYLKIIVRDAILLKKFDHAYDAIDIIKNYCDKPIEAQRLSKRVRYYEHYPLAQYFFNIFSKAKLAYFVKIKSIFLTRKFDKVLFEESTYFANN